MEYAIAYLTEQTGVAARTIREWIRLELLPRPVGTGPAALYTREHLLRIWAIVALRREGHGLDAIREHLATVTLRELERYRPRKTVAPPVAAVAPEPQPSSSPPVEPTAPSPRLESGAPTDAAVAAFDDVLPGRRYALVPLLPGLVLMVDEGVSGFVRRTALEIVDRYAASKG